MRNYPFSTKSSNPKRWMNWLFMDGEVIAWWTGFTMRGFMPNIKFFGLSEADGASINDFRHLAQAVEDAIRWGAKVCKTPKVLRGAALELLSAESFENYSLYVFPIFMRDKDRTKIYVKVYTDATHGGSVVMWADELTMSDVQSMAQFHTMLLRAVDFGITDAKKYTRR